MEFKILNDINEDIIAIRTEAFIKGRNVPPEVELDGRDKDMLHFCLYNDDVLVAYFRAECNGDFFHIGRVAVKESMRRNGYGRMLLEYFFDYAREHGYKYIELSAVDTAVGFYEKLGFVPEGDYYMETGVLHIYMKKMLKNA